MNGFGDNQQPLTPDEAIALWGLSTYQSYLHVIDWIGKLLAEEDHGIATLTYAKPSEPNGPTWFLAYWQRQLILHDDTKPDELYAGKTPYECLQQFRKRHPRSR